MIKDCPKATRGRVAQITEAAKGSSADATDLIPLRQKNSQQP